METLDHAHQVNGRLPSNSVSYPDISILIKLRLCLRVKIYSLGDIFFLLSQTLSSVSHGGGSETLGIFLNYLLLYFLERRSANVLET